MIRPQSYAGRATTLATAFGAGNHFFSPASHFARPINRLRFTRGRQTRRCNTSNAIANCAHFSPISRAREKGNRKEKPEKRPPRQGKCSKIRVAPENHAFGHMVGICDNCLFLNETDQNTLFSFRFGQRNLISPKSLISLLSFPTLFLVAYDRHMKNSRYFLDRFGFDGSYATVFGNSQSFACFSPI